MFMAFASGSYHTYYEILGLSPGASLTEIKQAYRRMAKQYHPDLNKSPDAQERFIEINEAYEFLLHLHTKAPAAGTAGRSRRSGSRYYCQPTADELFRQWMENERRKARARAAAAARKRYEEFRRSRIFRTSQIVSDFYDYLFVVIGMIIILSAVASIVTKIMTPPDPVTQEKSHLGTYIFTTVILSVIGIVFIIFAGSNILEQRKRRKREKRRTARK